MPVVCGGHTCYKYNPLKNMFEKFAELDSEMRVAHSIATSDSEILVVGSRSNKTEFVNADGRVRNGPDLPAKAKRYAACFVKLDDHLALLTGGRSKSGGNYFLNQNFFYNIPSKKWNPNGPIMNDNRSWFGCDYVLDKDDLNLGYVLAIGGLGLNFRWLSSTEILINKPGSPQHMKWIRGPALKTALSKPGAATSPDKLRLFVLGGSYSKNVFSKSIFRFQCSGQKCQWDELETRLRTAREFETVLFFKHDCRGTQEHPGTGSKMF